MKSWIFPCLIVFAALLSVATVTTGALFGGQVALATLLIMMVITLVKGIVNGEHP